MSKLFSVDIRLAATVYVKADSEADAAAKVKTLNRESGELREAYFMENLPINGDYSDDETLPEMSLSPAVTIYVDGMLFPVLAHDFDDGADDLQGIKTGEVFYDMASTGTGKSEIASHQSVSGKPHFVQWWLTGQGYAVSVFDAESQPVEEFRAGNHPGISDQIGVERKVGSLKLAEWAAQTAGELAAKHGIEAAKISQDCDSERDCQNDFDMTVCVWRDEAANCWRWDDAEDHGGFDSVSPSGPFATEWEAWEDAEKRFPNTSIFFEHGKPIHYPEV